MSSLPEAKWMGNGRFISEYVQKGTPVVLRGVGVKRWNAIGKWTPEMFKDVEEPVWISVGNEECSSKTIKKKIPLGEYCERLEGGYLKQFELETITGDFSKEISPIDLFDTEYYGSQYFWMGPAGCTTGLHHDDEHSLLCQIYGEKTVFLLPPGEAKNCYKNEKYDSGTTCFDFTPATPDFTLHPKATTTAAKILKTTLLPGDAVLIPKYWLHSTTTPTPSMSINLFASTFYEQATDGLIRRFYDFLHRIGVYKASYCVCHHGDKDFAKMI
eukprot:TRINITY_DN1575_c3_g1_i1.p1 TRINITY_DN1575_c3_g1~~TRINITY_DN1575_c3_g1_i1.p1  ORF type:complete len:271 (+),score=21.01 TRINITY_DN1575_c3_g1_i1:60-872(+)